ncbi:PEGA domain-containing protein [Akkermansiaceae bacterium]|nr:PEGA domain-containing protein [Akkermansiaceae bacterium]
MKGISRKILCALAILSAPAAAQEEEQEFGTLNILSLVAGDTPCEVKLSGQAVMPDGLKAGNTTGWFFIPAGKHEMRIGHPEFRDASGTIEVAKGSTQVVVVFLMPSKRIKVDGTPYPPDLRIRRYPAFETPKGFALKAASMLEEPARYSIGGKTFSFEKADAIDIPNWNGNGFKVSQGEKTLASISNREDRGSYYVFFAGNPDGTHLAGIVHANPIAIPKP